MHTLFVIAVPIGNLKEITYLAVEKLTETPVIFCEDTRVTKQLFSKLKIPYNNKEFHCINQFNESSKHQEIMSFLDKSDCALVSDAGYPVISDPGFFLIKKLRQNNVNIQVINGPCAFIHAIVSSGIESQKIFWCSFLSKKTAKRITQLKELKEMSAKATIVFYEPKNHLIQGLKVLMQVFGDIEVGVAKELTKMYETFYFDKISVLLQKIEVKGEFVVLIPRQIEEISILEIDEILEKMHQDITQKQITLNSAVKIYKNKIFPSSLLYKEYISKYKS